MDYDSVCPWPGETWDEVAEASLLHEPTPWMREGLMVPDPV
jgi:hypothetical protein